MDVELGALTPNEPTAFDEIAEKLGAGNGQQPEENQSRDPAAVAPLVIEAPVRSGQSIVCESDVTVIGSVASGADVIAGGSIHIYGTARGAGHGRSQWRRARPDFPPPSRSRTHWCQRLLHDGR